MTIKPPPLPENAIDINGRAATAWSLWFDQIYQTLRSVWQVLSVQTGGDTNNSSSGSGSDYGHSLTYTLPANFLTKNKVVKVTAHFSLTTGTPGTLNYKLILGSAVISAIGTPAAPASSLANDQIGLSWILQATDAPSATSNLQAAMLMQTPGSVNNYNSINMPVAVATNGSLIISLATNWSGAGIGTNTVSLNQFIVETVG